MQRYYTLPFAIFPFLLFVCLCERSPPPTSLLRLRLMRSSDLIAQYMLLHICLACIVCCIQKCFRLPICLQNYCFFLTYTSIRHIFLCDSVVVWKCVLCLCVHFVVFLCLFLYFFVDFICKNHIFFVPLHRKCIT